VSHWLAFALGGIALVAPRATALAAEIRTLQLTTTNDTTRAIFDLSAPLEYRLFEIANPDRIVLDLHTSSFADRFVAPAG